VLDEGTRGRGDEWDKERGDKGTRRWGQGEGRQGDKAMGYKIETWRQGEGRQGERRESEGVEML